MHRLIQATLVILMISLYAGCTTDDICSEETQTTPNLVINFADNKIAGVAKPLSHIMIRNLDLDTLVWNAPADTIAIPLYTDADRSTYAFTIFKEEVPYTNIYQFDYTREEIYVSRACGFKMHFENLKAEAIPNENLTTGWTKNITIIKPIVEDEKSTHITILH